MYLVFEKDHIPGSPVQPECVRPRGMQPCRLPEASLDIWEDERMSYPLACSSGPPPGMIHAGISSMTLAFSSPKIAYYHFPLFLPLCVSFIGPFCSIVLIFQRFFCIMPSSKGSPQCCLPLG